jgi:hypothetical protein
MINQFIDRLFNGIPVIELSLIKNYKQTRTHKKRRINKKWRKRYGFTSIYWESDTCYLSNIGGRQTLICHPNVVKLIKEKASNG